MRRPLKPRVDPYKFIDAGEGEGAVAARLSLGRPKQGDADVAQKMLAGISRDGGWADGGLAAATSELARAVSLGGDCEGAARAILALQDNARAGDVYAPGLFACDAAPLQLPGLLRPNADPFAHSTYALQVLLSSGRGENARVKRALETFRRLAANGSYCCRHCTHLTLRLWAECGDRPPNAIRDGLGWLWGREAASGQARAPVFMLDTLNRLPVEEARVHSLTLLEQVIPTQGRDGSWGTKDKYGATTVVVRSLERASSQ